MIHSIPIPAALRQRLEAFHQECFGLSFSEVMFPQFDLLAEVRESLQSSMDWQTRKLIGPIYINLAEGIMSSATIPKVLK